MMRSFRRCQGSIENVDNHDQANSPLTSRNPFHIHTWLRFSFMDEESVRHEAVRRRCL